MGKTTDTAGPAGGLAGRKQKEPLLGGGRGVVSEPPRTGQRRPGKRCGGQKPYDDDNQGGHYIALR